MLLPVGQRGHQLGYVHRAATAETDYGLRLELLRSGDGGGQILQRRLAVARFVNAGHAADCGERRLQPFAQRTDRRTGYDQHTAAAHRGEIRGALGGDSRPKAQGADIMQGKCGRRFQEGFPGRFCPLSTCITGLS